METGRVRQIVEQCQQGNREAFGELYTLMHDPLLKVCQRFVSDENTSEDLLHDAFLLIFSKIGSLKDTSRAEAWMQKVTSNLSLAYLQHRKQQPVVPLDDIKDATVVPTSVEAVGTYEDIMELVDQLPNSYRRVFRLSVLEGMSHQQIANLLNIDPHTSSAELFRAKKMLKRSLVVLLLGLMAIGVPIGLWHLLQQSEGQKTAQQQPPSGQEPAPKLEETSEETDGLPRLNQQFTQPKLTVYLAQTDSLPRLNSELPASLVAETRQVDSTLVREESQPAPSSHPKDTPRKTNLEMPEVPIRTITRQEDWVIQLAYSGINSHPTFNLPYGEKDMNDPEIDTITHHRLPITVALQVSKMLGSNLALGTGLQYTQLYSETQVGNTYSWMQQELRLHYLGIPLRVMWYPVNTSRWRVYGSAQTMLEVPVGSSLHQQDFVEGLQIDTRQLSPSLSVQWSVGLGIGLEYRLTPAIGLFAEPGVHYFFKTGDGLDTYRTKHPAAFSIPIGIRINIK